MVLVDGKPLAMQYLDSERPQSKVGRMFILSRVSKTALKVRYRADESRVRRRRS